jgi:hypothetical protein
MGMERIRAVRDQFPPKRDELECVRELDEQLGHGRRGGRGPAAATYSS